MSLSSNSIHLLLPGISIINITPGSTTELISYRSSATTTKADHYARTSKLDIVWKFSRNEEVLEHVVTHELIAFVCENIKILFFIAGIITDSALKI